eukprot:m.139154 g.139154  ORF g.139154 m.139154 type:complete len:384 (+) comp30040_c3_seq1:148-1299(+)
MSRRQSTRSFAFTREPEVDTRDPTADPVLPDISARRKHVRTENAAGGYVPCLLDEFVDNKAWRSLPSANDGLFTFRSNVMYNGHEDPTPPLFGQPISFKENDFVQVVQIATPDWWIGRVIGAEGVCKYIPSCSMFASKHYGEHQSYAKTRPDTNESDEADTETELPFSGMSFFTENKHPVHCTTGYVPTMVTRWVNKAAAVYDLSPHIRPLIIVGPSAPKYELTKNMQASLTKYLQATFPNACQNFELDDPDQTASKQLTLKQMDYIFEMAAKGKMALLHTQYQDVNKLRSSAVMPILVLLKITNVSVLKKLLTNRDHPRPPVGLQLSYADKLHTIPLTHFDIVLNEASIQKSCYNLASYVDAYIRDVNRPVRIESSNLHSDQ